MAQTISELEKERAKLLEAIETQASQISKKRAPTSSNEATPHTLNDWLNAAEQVMPQPTQSSSRSSSARDQRSAVSRPTNTSKSNKPAPAHKASFFGVVIMLSLLFTVIGLIYIAYTAVQKDLQQVVSLHDETLDTISQVQAELIALREMVEQGGDSEAFSALLARLDQQEQEINGLKHLQSQPQNRINPNALRDVTQSIERQMDSRLQGLVSQLKMAGVSLDGQTNNRQAPTIAEPQVAEPTPPSEPKIEQKVVRLVESKSAAGGDERWIKQQPAENYVLQLASMSERAGIEKVIADKNIQGGRIIPQIRDGRQSFVLVVGSHSQRTEANQASIQIKEQTDISPWIRRVRDLTGRME